MNEQQLQQILTIQQAIAAAATAAVINSLLNPQQAAAANQNALTDSPTPNNETHDQQHPDSRQGSPMTSGSPLTGNQVDTNNRTIQELLLQLQQQANAAGGAGAVGGAGAGLGLGVMQPNQIPNISQAASALNFNLNNQLSSQPNLASSPISRLLGQNDFNAAALAQAVAAATTSGNIPQQQPSQSPNHNNSKKLKRHHQSQISPQQAQPFPSQHSNRSSLDATSKPLQQQSLPKSHSTMSNTTTRNSSSGTNSSSTSSTFLPNNVGLPRKLVRGQDVWLGRGAEQTRQILKCMWCGQSFRTLAEMTQHMKVTQHYTNIISQEQITSWKQPESSELTPGRQQSKQSMGSRNQDDLHDTSSEKFNDSDRDDSFSNDEEPPLRPKSKSRPANSNRSSDRQKTKGDSTSSNDNKDPTRSRGAVVKPAARNRKRQHEDDDESLDFTENTDVELTEGQEKIKSEPESNDEHATGDDIKREAMSPEDYSKTEAEQDRKSDVSKERTDDNDDQKKNNEITENGDASQPDDRDEAKDSKVDQLSDEAKDDEDDRHSRNEKDDIDEESSSNSDECDRTSRKDSRHEKPDIAANVIKQQPPEGQKGDGSGDPLSALESMVEKSFDPRMRPGLASGGILQRLGIDEEVCPPWQHINYANWYAAAAYGHPMAAALLAAGINLQNGIKLSKNMNPKKSDD